MHKKSPVKVKLQIGDSFGGSQSYMIKQIDGAVTIGSYNGQILRAGDYIDETQADALTQSYLVTVVTK